MESKTKVHPGVLAAVLGGISALLLSLQAGLWFEPFQSGLPPIPRLTVSPVPVPKLSPPQPTVKPSPVPNGLRVSNQTPNAVRVVLMAQNSKGSSQTAYLEPAHWDFAPGEGSQQGLILSLPGKNLSLKTGDILVAFALDGSQRYWGPYVVGKTATPVKRGQSGEWYLVLQP